MLLLASATSIACAGWYCWVSGTIVHECETGLSYKGQSRAANPSWSKWKANPAAAAAAAHACRSGRNKCHKCQWRDDALKCKQCCYQHCCCQCSTAAALPRRATAAAGSMHSSIRLLYLQHTMLWWFGMWICLQKWSGKRQTRGQWHSHCCWQKLHWQQQHCSEQQQYPCLQQYHDA